MFRFTIRDVMWLTVVVALAVGWWVDHSRLKYVAKAMYQQFVSKGQVDLPDGSTWHP